MVTIDVGQENKASLKHQTNKMIAKRMTLLQPLDICNYFVMHLESIQMLQVHCYCCKSQQENTRELLIACNVEGACTVN